MTPDELTFLEWAGGLVTAAGGVIMGWIFSRVTTVEEDHTRHELYVERTFAKREDVNDNFDKLHSCIDDMQKNMQTMSVSQATLATNMANMAASLQNLTTTMQHKN